MRIAVTSGYARSLHAIAVIHGLAQAGHEVALVLNVRLLNLGRVRFYLRQLGPGGVWKKARGRLLGPRAAPPDLAREVEPMRAFLRERGISSRSVAAACRSVGARLRYVQNLNAPRALATLRAARPDLVVYVGGGLVRPAFLAIPPRGVLNAHAGPLPRFRGMNAAEWALFHGIPPCVVVHYMDAGIDTGPILLHRPIPADAWRDYYGGRGASTRVSVEALLEAVELVAGGDQQPVPQSVDAGRQYFVMAEPLREVLQRWIGEGRTPVHAADTWRFRERAGEKWAADRP